MCYIYLKMHLSVFSAGKTYSAPPDHLAGLRGGGEGRGREGENGK